MDDTPCFYVCGVRFILDFLCNLLDKSVKYNTILNMGKKVNLLCEIRFANSKYIGKFYTG